MIDYLIGLLVRLFSVEGRDDVKVFKQAHRHIREAQALPYHLGGERVTKIFNDRSGDEPIYYEIAYRRQHELSNQGRARGAFTEFWVMRGERLVGIVMLSGHPRYGHTPTLTPAWALTA